MKIFKLVVLNVLKVMFIPLYTIYSNCLDGLNPCFYSFKRRVVKIVPGQISFDTNQRALFVIYQPKCEIPFYILNVLNALKELKINCSISVNQEIGDEAIKQLSQICDVLLVRKNFGRDFAAYKDLVAHTDLNKLDRLILLNDSMFYFSKNLKQVFAKFIDPKYDVVSLTESPFNDQWHVQSYLLGFSKNIFLSDDFKKYWQNYLPFNSRRHNIYEGEISFSQAVLKKYYRTSNVVYNVSAVLSIAQHFSKEKQELLPALLPKKDLYANDYQLSDVMHSLEQNNVSHYGAFILPLLFNSAIIKRDIVYKKTFFLYEATQGLMHLSIDNDEMQKAVEELTHRKTISQWPITVQILLILGLK